MTSEQQQQQSKKVESSDDASLPLLLVPVLVEPPILNQRRRRLVGRAARRRRRKFKQICALENHLFTQQQQQQETKLGEDNKHSMAQPTVVMTCNNSHAVAVADVLPIDRDRIWPAVIELRTGSKSYSGNNDCSTATDIWTNSDEAALIKQLGYVPGNAIKVVCRMRDLISNITTISTTTTTTAVKFQHYPTADIDGDDDIDDTSPVVIQLYPIVYRNPHAGGKSGGKPFKLRKRQKTKRIFDNAAAADDDVPCISSETSLQQQPMDTSPTAAEEEDPMVIEPFPTTYWLTHPLLRCIVSKLELEGYGIELERRLQGDVEALQLMEWAHTAYGQERYNFLSVSDRQLIHSYHWETAFAIQRGVAGITKNKPHAVKCLHAHLAHYLSNSPGCQYNIVGQWVWTEMQLRYATKITDITTTTATTIDET